MTDSKKIYKNLAFTIVTALVLVAATLAWFASSSQTAEINEISVDVPAKEYVIEYFEAVDANHDGAITELTEPYEKISGGTSLDITDMTPGKTNFYRIDVTAFAANDFTLLLNNIVPEIEGESVTVDELYEAINIAISCDAPEGVVITPSMDSYTLKDYILDYTGGSSIPTSGTVCALLVPQFELGDSKTVSIYYQIGLDGSEATTAENALHLTDGFQGARVSIDAIGFTVTTPE